MLKKLNSFFVMSLMFITISVFSQAKVKVIVSFNAMREFTDAVGKDLVEIKTVIPDGVEPHDFEPKASDLVSISYARVFVYNGFGMEKWVDKSLKAVNNKNIVVVDASLGFTPIRNTDPGEIKEHGQFDPHIWLSLKGAQNCSKNIKDALVKVDPLNKDKYEKNYYDFYNQLETLFDNYNSKLSSLKNKSFVTGHAAFAYFTRDFGLEQKSIENLFAEGEPSAKKMASLIEYCKKNKIKTIFVEDMVSPKVSETLAREIGAKTWKIHTIESRDDKKNYLESMKDNLEMIYNSLK